MGLKDLVTKSPRGQRMEMLGSFGEVAGLGLSFVFALLIGTFGGWWLDKHFGWAPYGVLAGIVVGLAAGVRNVVLVTRKYLK